MNDTKDLQNRLRGVTESVGMTAQGALTAAAADALEAQDKRIAELEDLAQGRLEQMESDRKQALRWRDELAARKWQTIETAPEPEVDTYGNCSMVLVNWKRKSRDESLPTIDVSNTLYLARNLDKATHWMPLPAAPGANHVQG